MLGFSLLNFFLPFVGVSCGCAYILVLSWVSLCFHIYVLFLSAYLSYSVSRVSVIVIVLHIPLVVNDIFYLFFFPVDPFFLFFVMDSFLMSCTSFVNRKFVGYKGNNQNCWFWSCSGNLFTTTIYGVCFNSLVSFPLFCLFIDNFLASVWLAFHCYNLFINL